ncbi:MAG: hypothetical protein KF812_08255 [Fimbriimonadaceae bacterium]|nr:hypothetical protein [Fimbriimonadaceae bacterium]
MNRFWASNAFLLLAVLAVGQSAPENQDPPTDPPVRTPPGNVQGPPPPVQGENDPNAPSEDSSQRDDLWQQILDELSRKLFLTGYRTIGFHRHTVTGDREAFRLSNYGGLGPSGWTNRGTIRVSGQNVFGVVNFDATFPDGRLLQPQDDRLSLNYDVGHWQIDLGDVRGRLGNTNRFTSLDKTMRGLSMSYASNGFAANFVRSEARGQTRTVTVPGNNTAGPYYLQGSQIVRGSETIQVDGVTKTLGTDYIVDYEIGSITFVNRDTLSAQPISVSSTIVATYEAYGLGNRGTVEGASASYDMGAWGRVGVTAMRQVTGENNSLSTRIERFQGFGPAGTPYVLQFEPLIGSIVVVRVDGVIQVEGADYVFDQVNRAIFYFTRNVPSNQTIEVVYTPRPRSTVQGDREAIGFDYRVPLGRTGFVRYQQGLGRSTNTPTPTSGLARGIDGRYTTGAFTLTANFLNVPSGFTGIESLGFERNQDAVDIRAVMNPSANLSYGINHSNRRLSSPLTTDTSRHTALEGFIRAGGDTRGWSLNQRRTSSAFGITESTSDKTTFSNRFSIGNWPLSLDLSHESLRGRRNGEPQSATVSGLNLVGRAPWEGSAWSLQYSAGFNQVRANGESGAGKDFNLGLGFREQRYGDDGNLIYPRWSTKLDFTDSDSGALSTIGGLSNGYGLGYNGNGFAGGSDSTFIGGGLRARQLQLTNQLDLSDRFSLYVSGYQRESEGDTGSNTNTRGATMGGTWDWGRNTIATGTLGFSDTSFLGSGIKSNATTISLGLDSQPSERFRFYGSLTGLFASGSTYAQDIWSADANVSYRFAPRHALIGNARVGRVSGYLAQDEQDFSLTYQYQIWKSLALNVGYRVQTVTSRDSFVSTGAFRSRGFDIELAFNFGF